MDAEILVAEDESAIREGLCALLESEGYTVRAAVDGEDALRLFRECRPDLVLLDVMMPKKNGYAVCSEIRTCQTAEEAGGNKRSANYIPHGTRHGERHRDRI